MIKLIVGTKGSGKTKAMIDMINDSVKTSKGNVVVVEKGMKLTYEVPNAARLIDLDEYKIAGGEMLYGFVAGLLASNYDITDLYAHRRHPEGAGSRHQPSGRRSGRDRCRRRATPSRSPSRSALMRLLCPTM